jgi:hypothetical protein
MLDYSWVKTGLPLILESCDLETLVTDAFSQGIIMGRLSTLYDLHAMEDDED